MEAVNETGDTEPVLVGLEYSEWVYPLLSALRPKVFTELISRLPWLDIRLANALASTMGWEVDFADEKWPTARRAWLDDGQIDDDEVEFCKLRAKILAHDLEEASVFAGVGYDAAKKSILSYARDKSKRVAEKDPTVIGMGPIFDLDGRDTRMFGRLRESITGLSKSYQAVIVVGSQHLIADERTLFRYCMDAGLSVRAHWLHET